MNQSLSFDYFYNIAYHEKKPVSAMIELLTQCNLRCQHCYIPSHTNQGLDFEKIEDILYELRSMGVLTLTLTGGEIFLHPHIMKIIALARKLHMRVFLLSNGTLLNEEIVKSLAEMHISEFSTTMFSLDPKVHDFITCQQGSLDMLLENLQLLKKYNITVKVKTPLLDVNAFAYREIKEYCKENGFLFMTSPIIFSKTDGDDSPVKLRVSDDKLCEVLKETDEADRKGKERLYRYDYPCAALFYTISIDAKGDVYPCSSLRYKIGNVFENTLTDIWNNSQGLKLIQSIKNTDLKECAECEYRDFCDRCPGIVFSETETLTSCEPFTKLLAKIRASNYLSI